MRAAAVRFSLVLVAAISCFAPLGFSRIHASVPLEASSADDALTGLFGTHSASPLSPAPPPAPTSTEASHDQGINRRVVVVLLAENDDLTRFEKREVISGLEAEHAIHLIGTDDVAYLTFSSASGSDISAPRLAAITSDARVQSADYQRLTTVPRQDTLQAEQWALRNDGNGYFIGQGVLLDLEAQSIVGPLTRLPSKAGVDVKWNDARATPSCNGQPCSGQGVLVGVLDSGFDASHPDLSGQIAEGSRSYQPGQPYTYDPVGHGTFVSSLIVGAENGVGITGIAPGARVFGVKLNNPPGEEGFTSDSIYNGLTDAVNAGVQVINLSLGAAGTNPQKTAVYQALGESHPEILVVAAAGNEAVTEHNPIEYPASFPWVISVGAHDAFGDRSIFSNYNVAVWVSAPGTAILGARSKDVAHCDAVYPYLIDLTGTYALTYATDADCFFDAPDVTSASGRFYVGNGTSYSTPIVAGAAALMKQKYGRRLTTMDFRVALMFSSDHPSLPSGQKDDEYGYGRLNLTRLLALNFPPEFSKARAQFSPSSVPNTGTASTQLAVQFRNLEGASDMTTVEADFSPLGLGTHLPMTLQQDADGVLTYATAPITVSPSVAPGSYQIAALLADQGGASGTISTTLTITATTGTPSTIPPSTAPPSSTPPTIVPVTNPTPTPLAITITGPKHGEDFTTNKKKVSLRGEVDADVATISVSGQEQTVAPGEIVWTAAVALDEGENTITAVAFDVARTRQAQTSITITRDTEAPDPVDDLEATPEGAQTRLSWSKPDDDIEGYHVYRVTGDDFEEIGVTRSRKYLTSDTGPFAVTAEDVAGNESDPEDSDQVRGGCESGFADVPPSHFASCAAASLRTRGIVQGWNGGFSPDSYVTRAEFAKMLAGVKGVSADSTTTTFRDVPSRHPLAGAVASVVRQGWASGQGAYFYPNRPITRMEAARMIARAAGLVASGDAGYSDVAPGDEMGIAAALRAAGIASGQDGRFRPTDLLTRGEAVKMLAGL